MLPMLGNHSVTNKPAEYPSMISNNKDSTLRMTSMVQTQPVPVKMSGVSVPCSIVHLTGEEFLMDIDRNATGRLVLEMFCNEHRLCDIDFFSFYSLVKFSQRNWIDNNKSVYKQNKPGCKLVLYFAVKFYPPDPTKVGDDFTRYMFCLQLRKDVMDGRIMCSLNICVQLAAYALQSEYGDYRQPDSPQYSECVTRNCLADSPTLEYLGRIGDRHKTLKELTSCEADLYFLDTVRKLPLYSFDMFAGESKEGSEVSIGVGCTGLCLYLGHVRIYRFTWLKIVKLSYRGHNFTIKFRGDSKSETGYSSQVYRMRDREEAKRLWKRAIECHMFFRLSVTLPDRGGMVRKFNSQLRNSSRSMRRSLRDILTEQGYNRGTLTGHAGIGRGISEDKSVTMMDTSVLTNAHHSDNDYDALRRAVMHVTGVSDTVVVEKININMDKWHN